MRPLKYSAKHRKDLYDGARTSLKEKKITKAQYEKRIGKLNKQELDARERVKEKKIRDEANKFAGAIRQKQVKYVRSINVKKNDDLSDVAFKGAVTSDAYDFTPEIHLTSKDTLASETEVVERAIELIIDHIRFDMFKKTKDRADPSMLISLETRVEDGGNQFFSIGKAYNKPFNLNRIRDDIRAKLRHIIGREEFYDTKLFLTKFMIKKVEARSRRVRAGGCDTDTHRKKFNDLKIMSPKSKNNNCLFACIHQFLGVKKYGDTTRKELGIELNTPIHIKDLERIAKYYGVKIVLYDMNAELIGEYGTGKTIHLLLFVSDENKGHYVLIEGETHVCDDCGKYWVNKHKCNLRRKMWINRMSGNRNVIPAKVERAEKFNDKNMLYFDLETFKPNGSDKIIPYAVSWFSDETYYQEYGTDAWEKFIAFLMVQKDKIVCAYNGCGFDFHFLMDELLKRGDKIDNVILSSNRLLTFKFGENNRCWDICLFTLSSLKDACKSFGVSDENSKTEFNHFKIKSWEDVYLYRDEVEPYVKRDVLGMKEVFDKFSSMLFEVFKVHMTEFVTLSSMSYAIWTTSLKELVELPDTTKYKFIRESLYGGRTYPMKREFTSKHYDEIVNSKSTDELKEIYKRMDDWIFNADATSLYPTAMVNYEYPIGISEWVENPTDISKIGIYEVDVECNTNLVVPILPEKDGKGGISWNLKPKRAVYTSQDLNNAIKYGYKITKIHRGLVWEKKGDIFNEYIMRCYKIKEENDDNPVLRQIGKILMNALYGKMLERARFEETKLCNNIVDVWEFNKQFSMTDVQFIKDKVVVIGMPIDDVVSVKRIRKPSQIGTFILSYSRTHMLNAMSSICPTLDKHFFTYTDTDSLHIHASTLPILEEKGWLSKGLGQLSDDAKGGRIFREINLAPKLYMYLCLMPDGKIKKCMKSKGIPQQYLSPHLFENADELEDDEKVIVMENRLKKVSLGKNLQIAFRKYDAFSILSIDMERTFYKNMWGGMDFKDGYWNPCK